MDARSSPTLRILIVDDNQEIAFNLAVSLKRRGHVVEVVHRGLAGVHAVASFWPDVVLLDVGLPDVSGYEVATKIRQQLGGTVALIAMTPWDWEADRARAQAAGFDEHLRRPVDITTLTNLLTELGYQKILRSTPETT